MNILTSWKCAHEISVSSSAHVFRDNPQPNTSNDGERKVITVLYISHFGFPENIRERATALNKQNRHKR